MKDNKIPEVKSLLWLAIQFPKVEKPQNDLDRMQNCINLYCSNAADLINRQKAEIERLNHIRAELSKENEEQDQAIINALHRMKVVRAEAIKEIAKRLKEGCGRVKTEGKTMLVFSESAFDYIVEEMTESEDETG